MGIKRRGALMIDGWFFIFFGVLLVFASVLPGIGKVRRNYLFGLRLEPFMRSERAWRDGHKAAGEVFFPAAAVLVAYGVCMLTEWPSLITRINLDVLRAVGVAILLIAVAWGTLRGVAAATRKDPSRT